MEVGYPPEPQVEMHADPANAPYGVRLEAQPAKKTEPFDIGVGAGQIVYDGGIYRTWYLEIDGNPVQGTGSKSQSEGSHSVTVCYEESVDGFEWRVANRSPVQLLPGHNKFDGVTFFIDPAAPAEERYKLIYNATPAKELADSIFSDYAKLHPRHQEDRIMGGHRQCLFALGSPDGLNWKPIEKPLMMHMSDTDTTFYYDEWLGKYVLYTRMYRQDRRWIGRAEAEDFSEWGPVEPIIWPQLEDPLDYDIYTNAFSPYPDLPQYRLMFPMFYHRYTERSDVHLYSSEDGIAWFRVPGGPVITPGEIGSWDSEFIGGRKDLVPLGDDRLAINYGGTRYPHKYPRWPEVFGAMKTAWAWWPKDRLCAIVADYEGGFYTLPLNPQGRRLQLNFRTVGGGEVGVGIAGVEGRSLEECDPLDGDHTDKSVSWKGETDINTPEGQEVTLQFKLRGAKLFSLEWRN